MRVISIFVIVPTLWAMLFPQTALASQTINTNTKTDFQTEKNISAAYLQNAPYNYEGYKPVENLPQTKNEKILAEWRKKQASKFVSLPQGQFVINASAYTAAADECGKSNGITASGIKVHEGTLACPPQYPFGTKIKIEGYGKFTCEDRGGAIKGNKFDIYMPTKKQAFAFGRRSLTAEVIN
jgi:3D (Asp-Asp-Asp) domain-containing protein